MKAVTHIFSISQ